MDFENVVSTEPKGYRGDDFSKVTQVYRVAQYNIACCYSTIGQVRPCCRLAPSLVCACCALVVPISAAESDGIHTRSFCPWAGPMCEPAGLPMCASFLQ